MKNKLIVASALSAALALVCSDSSAARFANVGRQVGAPRPAAAPVQQNLQNQQQNQQQNQPQGPTLVQRLTDYANTLQQGSPERSTAERAVRFLGRQGGLARHPSVENFNQVIANHRASEAQVADWIAGHSNALTGAAQDRGHFDDFALTLRGRNGDPLVRVNPNDPGQPRVNPQGEFELADPAHVAPATLAAIRDANHLHTQEELDQLNQQHQQAMQQAQAGLANQIDQALEQARRNAVDYMRLPADQQNNDDVNEIRDAARQGMFDQAAVDDAVAQAVQQARQGMFDQAAVDDAVAQAVQQARQGMFDQAAVDDAVAQAVQQARQGYVPENDLEHVTNFLGKAYGIGHVDANAVLSVNDGQAAGEKMLDAFTKAGLLRPGGDFNANVDVNNQDPDTLKNVVRRANGQAYKFVDGAHQWNFFGLEVARDGSLKALVDLF